MVILHCIQQYSIYNISNFYTACILTTSMIVLLYMDITGGLPAQQAVVFYISIIWSLFWKGLALWRAANLKQRNWFIVIIILNTLGLIEIIYLFRFAKKRMTWGEFTSIFKSAFYTKHESK